MPNCFSSLFICLHRVQDAGGSWQKDRKRLKMNKSRMTWLTKSAFCFHNSYCHISRVSRVHCARVLTVRLLFPPRSVIQLHYLDVLLKSIMDSGGFLCLSSSFTEYSQCYSNLPTTASCIGNEPPHPTPPPTQQPPWDSATSTHIHQINTPARLTKTLKTTPLPRYFMQRRGNERSWSFLPPYQSLFYHESKCSWDTFE